MFPTSKMWVTGYVLNDIDANTVEIVCSGDIPRYDGQIFSIETEGKDFSKGDKVSMKIDTLDTYSVTDDIVLICTKEGR